MPALGPRIIIAGTHSGVGKTTVATGLMAALAAKGLRVAAAKVGPDFIDPGYHTLATGRPGRSLDAWLSGEDLLAPLAAAAGEGADVLIVEGVMGLFDGSSEPGCDGSTAAVARLLEAPVVLVVDASAMSGSVAAIVHGYRDFDRRVQLAGVVLNRVGSEGHAALLREALEPLRIPVMGMVLEDEAMAWRERHLGLVPVAERPDAVTAAIERVAAAVGRACDLEALMRLAMAAPVRTVAAPPVATTIGKAKVAIAAGPVFTFVYPENTELLEQAGAELLPFDPLSDASLPRGCDAMYVGGGFPELFAPALGDNRRLIDDVRREISRGLTVWGECGGLLWLSRSLDGIEMVGAIDAEARMTGRLTIGYRAAVTLVASPLGVRGTALRGHEFHWTTTEPSGEAVELGSRFGRARAGFASPRLFASYLHQHLAADPAIAERFVAAAISGRPPLRT